MSLSKIKMRLTRDWERHTGHCQVTYTCKNEAGQRLVYCLQDNGERYGGVRLMRCSQDGEPSHEVSFKNSHVDFQRPPGDSRLENLVRDWISKYELERAPITV